MPTFLVFQHNLSRSDYPSKSVSQVIIVVIVVSRYKAEAAMDASPEDTFRYVDPTPDGPRSKWDKAVKELSIIAEYEKVCIRKL